MTTTTMPQPPTRPAPPRVYRVTPARARAYGLCPLQCREVQIHRRHRPSAFTGEAASRGRALHELLLAYNRALLRDGRPPAVDDLIRHVWAPGVFPAAGEQESVDLARRTLHVYGDVLAEEGLTVLAAEEWVKTAPRPLLDAPHLAVELSGTPDVLARRADGSIVALDLKTGASLPDPSALADDLGTVVYHLLAAYRCATTAIEVAQVAPHRGDWVAVALDGVRVLAGTARLRAMVVALDADDFPPRPGQHCVICPAEPACPARYRDPSWAAAPF